MQGINIESYYLIFQFNLARFYQIKFLVYGNCYSKVKVQEIAQLQSK